MKLDHMVILLSDLSECVLFYDALLPLLGFEKLREHVFANEEGIHLDFRSANETDPGYRRFAPGLNHLGFTAPDRQTLAKLQSTMSEAGFDVPEIQSFDDGSAIFFKDHDGMRIEVGVYD